MTMPLDQQRIDEWLTDLRTTTAPQTRGALTGYVTLGTGDDRPVGYCCLGRGEIVCGAEQEGVQFGGGLARHDFIEWLGFDMADHYREMHEGEANDCDCEFDLILDWPDTFPVVDGWGEDGQPILGGPADCYSAAGLNDDGLTFAQIADLFDYFGVKAWSM